MGKIVAFIPVRGGSKGIPNKNINLINSKPLVYWVIEAALGCNKIHDVYISTDSSAIADKVNLIQDERLHVINRSKETSTDQATTESAMLEFAEQYEFDKIILIQATSPLLQSYDLDTAISSLYNSKADSLLSVAQQKLFVWEDNNGYAKPVNYDYSARPRRQDFEGIYTENGAFYITSKDLLIKSKCRMSGKIIKHIMPDNTRHEIDEPDDWAVVEHLLKKRNLKDNERPNKIKLFATDVDGVLTDAGMYYANNGEEQKKFNTRDGKGFELLRNNGFITAIITSENTKIVENRAAKLKINTLYQGVEDKLQIINEIIVKHNIKLDEVCYIGDDLNDLEILKVVGFSCCPNDAVDKIKNIVDFVCEKKGGEGCVREVCDLLIQKNLK
jgi:YrbI family 3-deoxy-D-manno-octulosonate 8-phosphate phosphatase